MCVVNCCRLLGVRSSVLEVRSWSANHVPVNLCKINVILCPDKKGQSPKAQLSPSKVPVLAKRRQISVGKLLWGQILTTCPTVIPEGARPPTVIPEGARPPAVIPEGARPPAVIPEGAWPPA